ncbi:MAG: putative DNA binding domain-containing protein [Gracilibacteraceae bacterium]|nr:putative DNA binding domain-containing protein [Gracilibacteraceae bacterium]
MESQNLEWKETWRDEYMKTLCAFANASGGTLEVGRDDGGVVVGVKDTAKLLEDLPNKIKNAMAIIPHIAAHEADGQKYITITVGAYPFPISYHGVYYIRSGSTTQELTGSALDGFMLRKQGRTWDGVPMPYVKFDDFERDAFKVFRRKAIASARLTTQDLEITDEVLLKNLRLVEGDYLKRAALLIFHQDPENWVPGAYVKVGLFENAADILYQDEIHGPLITMADKVEDLVYTKYFKGFISYEGLQRIETFPVPRRAFREAVLNAIQHRDYSTGNPIHIHIYPDKVLIYNDGRLPENWTVDKLFATHTSMPYNPLIAGAFFRSGQIEAWGRGIEKITDSCKSWGKAEPFYEVHSNYVMIGFNTDTGIGENIVESIGEGATIGENIVENGGYIVENTKSIVETIKSIVENGENIVENIEENRGSIVENTESIVENIVENGESIAENVGVNSVQIKILELMQSEPRITAKSIANEIGIAPRNVQAHIQTLKATGSVKRVGPAKGGHWVVRTPE